MTYCKHCSIDSATVRWQAERIEELEQQVARTPKPFPAPDDRQADMQMEFKLTPSESAILLMLLQRERVSRQALIDCYKHKDGAGIGPRKRLIDVYVSKIRIKLKPLGVQILNIRDYGYYIPRDEIPRVLAKIAA